MSEAKLLKIDQLPIGEITIATRLRPVSKAGVAAVLASLQEIGHIVSPLWVRKTKADYVLLDGAHRLEAARQHGLETLPVRAFSCNDRQARFLEIDGNLAGAELTALDTAVFLAARKKVYEEEHPETKGGVAGGLARQGLATELGSFAAAAAEKLGITERQVRKITSAGEALTPEDVQNLRFAQKPVYLKDLLALSKIGDDEIRRAALWVFRNSTVSTIRDAIAFNAKKASGEKPAVKDPVEEGFKALLTAWKRAPKEVKRRFVAASQAEIYPLIVAANLGGDDA